VPLPLLLLPCWMMKRLRLLHCLAVHLERYRVVVVVSMEGSSFCKFTTCFANGIKGVGCGVQGVKCGSINDCG